MSRSGVRLCLGVVLLTSGVSHGEIEVVGGLRAEMGGSGCGGVVWCGGVGAVISKLEYYAAAGRGANCASSRSRLAHSWIWTLAAASSRALEQELEEAEAPLPHLGSTLTATSQSTLNAGTDREHHLFCDNDETALARLWQTERTCTSLTSISSTRRQNDAILQCSYLTRPCGIPVALDQHTQTISYQLN